MPDSVFVDTNVLVYARDAGEAERQPRASAWLEALWRRRTGRLSVQVLSEYYAVVTAKLDPGLPEDVARADVRNLSSWRPLPLDTTILERAWRLGDRFALEWWDALVVSAAQVAGCRLLLSEDFQDGQDFEGVRVVDPFAHEPDEF